MWLVCQSKMQHSSCACSKIRGFGIRCTTHCKALDYLATFIINFLIDKGQKELQVGIDHTRWAFINRFKQAVLVIMCVQIVVAVTRAGLFCNTFN